MATETTEQKLARLEAENEALKAAALAGNAFKLKVSEKGAVSVYGMGRFPVTLYKEQWLRLFSRAGEIVAFIKENDSKLSVKNAA